MNTPHFDKNYWSGIIGDDFTTQQLIKIASAVAGWMKEKDHLSAIVGYDTRFGGELFAHALAGQLSASGISTIMSETYITSPMLILNMVKNDIDIGLMVTGSDLPSSHSGVKLKGVREQADIDLINKKISESGLLLANASKECETTAAAEQYLSYVQSTIDLKSIHESGLLVVFDAMYGAAQSIYDKLLPVSIKLRAELNPSFKGDTPSPRPENLELLLAMTKGTEYAVMGFALDSDGEQVAICDEMGMLVNPYELLRNEQNMPWRDGLYLALKLLEKMVKSGKKLSQLS